MASLIKLKSPKGKDTGRWAIQFVAKDGTRPLLRIGKMARKAGDAIRAHVDNLVNSSVSGQPIPRDTAEWLSGIGDDLHAKLAKVKLVTPRAARVAAALEKFCDAYIARRTDLKPTTINNLKQARNWLVKHFGKDRDVATITKGEVGDWHRLVKASLSKATGAMHVKKARQMFQDAVDRRLIAENPVRGLKAGSMENRARMKYVPVETVEQVIRHCPDAEWKLIFALSRYQGLRVPSETSALRWSDVDWDGGRMLVRSPKTEHHDGKSTRVVPIFPETVPYLRDAFELAEPGAVNVVRDRRGENLRTTALKILKRAGVEPWVKIFQNMRSSRETDLTSSFPLHVACAWIGNSMAVAKKHYLQVTEGHFERASGKALQNPLRTAPDTHRTQGEPTPTKPLKNKGNDDSKCPRWESNKGRKTAEYSGYPRKTLRKALRRLKTASPGRYRDTMAGLRNPRRAVPPADTAGAAGPGRKGER